MKQQICASIDIYLEKKRDRKYGQKGRFKENRTKMTIKHNQKYAFEIPEAYKENRLGEFGTRTIY